MSLTVYKRKMNGEIIPIKLSIWDAFHGCPNPRPRRKDPVSRPFFATTSTPRLKAESYLAKSTDAYQCACCGKFHGMTDNAREQYEKDECVRKGGNGAPGKQIEWKGDKNNNNTKANKGGEGGNKQHAFSTSAEETFTDADDVIILQMKSESQSWAEILKALGKTSKSQVQARYKELEGKPAPGKTDDNKPDDKSKADKKAKAEKDRAEGLKKQAEAKGDKTDKGRKGKGKGKGQEKKVWSESFYYCCEC